MQEPDPPTYFAAEWEKDDSLISSCFNNCCTKSKLLNLIVRTHNVEPHNMDHQTIPDCENLNSNQSTNYNKELIYLTILTL